MLRAQRRAMIVINHKAFVLIGVVCLLYGTRARAQFDIVEPAEQNATPQTQGASGGPIIIDSPPPAPEVALQQPGQVLVRGKPVRVRFQSQTPGVSFQLQTSSSYASVSGVSYGVGYGFGYPWGYGWGYGGMAPYYGAVVTKSYQPLCTAPCEATMLTGRHSFALSLNDGPPLDVSRAVDITDNSIVDARYVSKAKLRKAGWGVFVAGTISGLAMMFASVNYSNDYYVDDQIRSPGAFYTGVGLFAGSIIAGAALAAQRDEASLRVYPAP